MNDPADRTVTAQFKQSTVYNVSIRKEAETTGTGESYTTTVVFSATVGSPNVGNPSVSFTIYGTEKQWTENNGIITWEQTGKISVSDNKAIVEDWCEGTNDQYSYRTVSWTGYSVTVDGHAVTSSDYASSTFEVDYNHAFELMHEAAITIETLYACVHTLDNINIERS